MLTRLPLSRLDAPNAILVIILLQTASDANHAIPSALAATDKLEFALLVFPTLILLPPLDVWLAQLDAVLVEPAAAPSATTDFSSPLATMHVLPALPTAANAPVPHHAPPAQLLTV